MWAGSDGGHTSAEFVEEKEAALVDIDLVELGVGIRDGHTPRGE